MNNTIATLEILTGSFAQGFTVRLIIKNQSNPLQLQFTGSLSPSLKLQNLLQQYNDTLKNWQATHRSWREITSATDPLTNQANISLKDIEEALNEWLTCQEFQDLRDQLLVHVKELQRISIKTNLPEMQKMPWENWDLIKKYCPDVEIFFQNNYSPHKIILKKSVKILLVLGKDDHLKNFDGDEKALKLLSESKSIKVESITIITPPDVISQINEKLTQQAWDIIFFAGHSRTCDVSHNTTFNFGYDEKLKGNVKASISDLSSSLRKAQKNGLKIAMFNSCDGLGIPYQLATSGVDIPYIIVMKEPIHNDLALHFVTNLCIYLSENNSLQKSFKEVCNILQSYRGNYPNADYIPAMFHHAEEPDIYFPKRNIIDRVIESFKANKLGLIAVVAVLGITCWKFNQQNSPLSSSPCYQKLQYLSCGDKKDIMKDDNISVNTTTAQDALQKQDISRAIFHTRKGWEEKKTPVTLITLNNALVLQALKEGSIKPEQVVYIALSVPYSSSSHYIPAIISRGMMKGVAELQDEFNKNRDNSLRLILLMSDDYNQVNQSKNIGQELKNINQVIGLVGSYSSHATFNIMTTIKGSDLVLVSPTASFSRSQLDNENNQGSHVDLENLFRVVSTTKSGVELIIKYLKKDANVKNVFVFFHANELFAKSFYGDLEQEQERLPNQAGLNWEQRKLSLDSFDEADIRNKVRELKSKYTPNELALIIVTKAYTNEISEQDPQKENQKRNIVIQENAGYFKIFGSNTMFAQDILREYEKIPKNQSRGAFVTVPWFPTPEQISEHQSFWGDEQVTWHYIFAYDSAKVLIEAILKYYHEHRRLPERADIKKVLRSQDFITSGKTGTITLKKNGDRREESSSLVTPDCNPAGCRWVEVDTLKEKLK